MVAYVHTCYAVNHIKPYAATHLKQNGALPVCKCALVVLQGKREKIDNSNAADPITERRHFSFLHFIQNIIKAAINISIINFLKLNIVSGRNTVTACFCGS